MTRGFCLSVAFVLLIAATALAEDARPRLLVLTDIGGDPDDTQSLVRLLVHSNEFEIEGLIASAAGVPGELKEAITRPDLIRQVVEAYGQVQPNLAKHAAAFPSAENL
ncbi:MAG TPA: nucleoside hydrolase-like domain-containing protein, partial [Pirellulaceae bacterium]|nr:nucleoside hydrolase-like domain-containing protein [Pirellulaceae bacterium]